MCRFLFFLFRRNKLSPNKWRHFWYCLNAYNPERYTSWDCYLHLLEVSEEYDFDMVKTYHLEF